VRVSAEELADLFRPGAELDTDQRARAAP
jgi:hypothetical protein